MFYHKCNKTDLFPGKRSQQWISRQIWAYQQFQPRRWSRTTPYSLQNYSCARVRGKQITLSHLFSCWKLAHFSLENLSRSSYFMLVKPREHCTHNCLDHLLNTGSEWKCLSVDWAAYINIWIVLALFSLTLTQLDVWPSVTPCTGTHWLLSHTTEGSLALPLIIHWDEWMHFVSKRFFWKVCFFFFNFKHTILHFCI